MSDAFTPMGVPPRLAPIPQPSAPPTPSKVDPLTGQPKRGRGRPPGARNRPKPVEGGINPPQRLVTPTQQNPPRASDAVDKKEASKEEKKARADQYATYINTELNDKLFMLIIGATNIPASAFYKEGRVPTKAAGNPDLTEFGNSIAIPPDVADSWGKLLAEVTYTDAGKGLIKATENHNLVIVTAALTAVFSTFRYYQQLKPTLDFIRLQQKADSEGGNEQENG